MPPRKDRHRGLIATAADSLKGLLVTFVMIVVFGSERDLVVLVAVPRLLVQDSAVGFAEFPIERGIRCYFKGKLLQGYREKVLLLAPSGPSSSFSF